MKISTKDMVLCAVFAAVLCVFSIITVPVGEIPITLGVFGVLFTAVVLGAKKSFMSVLVFILIGAAGMPVFSGMKGGAGVILGPTGGYITSYIFMALIAGAAASKTKENPAGMLIRFAACIISVLVCYLLGTMQFVLVSGNTFLQALAICVYPFVAFDLLKSAAAVFLGGQVRKRLVA